MTSGLRSAGDSVRVRITVIAAAASLVALTVGSVLFVVSLHRSLETGLRTAARQEIATIRTQLEQGGTPDEVVVTGGDDIVVQLVSSGRVVASDHDATDAEPLRTTPGVTDDLAVPGQSDLYAVVAEKVTGVPTVDLVVVGRSTNETDRARNVTGVQLLFAVPLAVLLLSVIVWVSVGRALRPVETMRREADSITSADLHRRLAQPPGTDEIPRLAATLNEMLDRIDRSQRQQRQFVSDASHELRSPLAAIRQTAEVARRQPERMTVDGLAGEVLDEGRRLEELVAALLLLARLDDDELTGAHEAVDLDDLVLDAVARTRPARASVTIDVSHVSAGQTRGSRVLLAQVVSNLLVNAVRHADTRVEVGLLEAAGWVELTVDNDGPPVPAADRERIFERFVRLDEARAREAGGVGLGLAIVRRIVDVSGGSVTTSEGPDGGARFTVRLPTANR